MLEVAPGQYWRHKRKRTIYVVEEIRRGQVRLLAQAPGATPTWKDVRLLAFDYERVPKPGSS
jgi:hypothetical protein